ncbi:tetratricopeptide repeat protein [Runella sp.]|uniref:tetratricopeptide repeat protein n=1 Tax=Runella sp. TaxID=1960881 RepID=UPI0030188278
MANQQLSEKIEAWLQGKLSIVEATAFEAEIAADPSLQEEVELHRLTIHAMEHLSEQDLQNNILDWMEHGQEEIKQEVKTDSPRFSALYQNLFRAAAVLLVFMAVFFTFNKIWNSTAEKQRVVSLEAQLKQQDSLLFELKQRPFIDPAKIDSLTHENAQLRERLKTAPEGAAKSSNPIAYYEKPKNLGGLLRTGDDPSVMQYLKSGAMYFQKSDMKQAENEASAALKIEPDNRDALRLLAHALFGQRRYLDAEPIFDQLQKAYTPSSDLAKEAEWNLLLCYRALSADANQQALNDAVLNAILKDTRHPYHKKALQMKNADKK